MRKKGNRINHRVAIKPLGIRNFSTYELPTRAALVAMQMGDLTSTNMAHLYSLASIASKLKAEIHIETHIKTVKRLCEQIYTTQRMDKPLIEAMVVSVNLLLDWLLTQSNIDISRAAQQSLIEISQQPNP